MIRLAFLSHVRGETVAAGVGMHTHKSTVRRHVGCSKGPNGWLLFQRQFSRDTNGRCERHVPELIRLLMLQMLSCVSCSRYRHAERQSKFKGPHSFIKSLGRPGVGGMSSRRNRAGWRFRADANCTDVSLLNRAVLSAGRIGRGITAITYTEIAEYPLEDRCS